MFCRSYVCLLELWLTHLCLRLLFFTHLQYESTIDTYIPTYPNNRSALAAESLIEQWNPLPSSGINTFMADPSIFTFPNIRFSHSPVPFLTDSSAHVGVRELSITVYFFSFQAPSQVFSSPFRYNWDRKIRALTNPSSPPPSVKSSPIPSTMSPIYCTI